MSAPLNGTPPLPRTGRQSAAVRPSVRPPEGVIPS